MAKMIGIVDTLGIESFIPLEGNERRLILFSLRARFNAQRNAQCYCLDLTSSEINKINEIIKDRKRESFIEAGKIITKKIDETKGTDLTEVNRQLLKMHKLRG